ncbi:Aste57867_18702 [Aphanomyces stellatus]|uniref:Aste57867_18702 protein n=1 Tax=Aphanomyces stellatus TaxID=120398 RepID=A0A485LBD3_9STRA|nr:hypothetical protein As57867_018639 [Aphanomyces stellatus]VFT95437.1 Aste57867_18702 [Aphanomyces stellatus]
MLDGRWCLTLLVALGAAVDGAIPHEGLEDHGHLACIQNQHVHVDIEVDGRLHQFVPTWEVAATAEASIFCGTKRIPGSQCGPLVAKRAQNKLEGIDALATYLHCRGHSMFEGHTSLFPTSERILRSLVSESTTIRRAMQIGFNAGHSAMTLLSANSEMHLTSFDLVEHAYVSKAAAFVDAAFPGRHVLIAGDSTVTIPAYVTDEPFDFIFVDGGHSLEVATADLANCLRLARAGTIVVMDDVVGTPNSTWTYGPTVAWNQAIGAGAVVELGRVNLRRDLPSPTWVQGRDPAWASAGIDGQAFGMFTGHIQALTTSL